MKSTTLGLMAKYWVPGRVKTRLGREIGMERACRVHRRFVLELLQRLAPCGQHRQWAITHPEPLPDPFRQQFSSGGSNERTQMSHPCSWSDGFRNQLRELDTWELVDQGDGDLGERMERWFERQFHDRLHSSTHKAVLVGGDCPTLSPEIIDEAFAQLTHHDLVLGPATDGGYYLIGLRLDSRFHPTPRWRALWDGVPWSTADVFETTLAIARSEGLTVHSLSQQSDVDTWADLRRLQWELAKSSKMTDQRLLSDLEDCLN